MVPFGYCCCPLVTLRWFPIPVPFSQSLVPIPDRFLHSGEAVRRGVSGWVGGGLGWAVSGGDCTLGVVGGLGAGGHGTGGWVRECFLPYYYYYYSWITTTTLLPPATTTTFHPVIIIILHHPAKPPVLLPPATGRWDRQGQGRVETMENIIM